MEWLLLLAFATIITWGIVIYNRLVVDRQRCLAGWSDIEVQLKRRHDLIPKLVEAVRQYAAYEQASLEQITELRKQASSISSAGSQGALESNITQSLISINALQEAYPELKADQNFLQLQEDITAVESDIQSARRYYNGAVRNLNARIESFPDLIVARCFRFKPAEYFEYSGSGR